MGWVPVYAFMAGESAAVLDLQNQMKWHKGGKFPTTEAEAEKLGISGMIWFTCPNCSVYLPKGIFMCLACGSAIVYRNRSHYLSPIAENVLFDLLKGVSSASPNAAAGGDAVDAINFDCVVSSDFLPFNAGTRYKPSDVSWIK